MNIDELEFIITRPEMSWTKGEKTLDLVRENIFDCHDVKKAIAEDIVAMHAEKPTRTQQYFLDQMKKETPEQRLLHYFGFCWSRVQWEMNLSRAFTSEPCEKICTFDLFLRPNAKLLLSMIDSVDLKSAKKYLKQWKKEHPRTERGSVLKNYALYSGQNMTIEQRKYHGYTYKVTAHLGHPNAYVKIPENHPLSGEGFEEVNALFEEKEFNPPHGWFTYSENGWLGWDYAHAGDYVANRYIPMDGKRWTMKEITDEVHEVIGNLKEIHNGTRNKSWTPPIPQPKQSTQSSIAGFKPATRVSRRAKGVGWVSPNTK